MHIPSARLKKDTPASGDNRLNTDHTLRAHAPPSHSGAWTSKACLNCWVLERKNKDALELGGRQYGLGRNQDIIIIIERLLSKQIEGMKTPSWENTFTTAPKECHSLAAYLQLPDLRVGLAVRYNSTHLRADAPIFIGSGRSRMLFVKLCFTATGHSQLGYGVIGHECSLISSCAASSCWQVQPEMKIVALPEPEVSLSVPPLWRHTPNGGITALH